VAITLSSVLLVTNVFLLWKVVWKVCSGVQCLHLPLDFSRYSIRSACATSPLHHAVPFDIFAVAVPLGIEYAGTKRRAFDPCVKLPNIAGDVTAKGGG
jgi:hypothetical protein